MLGGDTIRDRLIEQFTREFGQPVAAMAVLVWSIPRTQHQPLHIWMDSVTTPNEVVVWVFDPAQPERLAAERLKVNCANEIEDLMRTIEARVPGAADR